MARGAVLLSGVLLITPDPRVSSTWVLLRCHWMATLESNMRRSGKAEVHISNEERQQLAPG